MKRIVSEDRASPNAQHGHGAQVPRAELQVPQYSSVSHALVHAPGDAAIKFNTALANESQAFIDNYQKMRASQERDAAMNGLNEKYEQEVNKFKVENPSGRDKNGNGLMDFATETYDKLSKKAISDCYYSSSKESVGALTSKGRISVAHSMYREQNQIETGFLMFQKQHELGVMLNRVYTDPDKFDVHSATIDAALADAGGLLGKREYHKLINDTRQDMYKLYGMAMIDRNPESGREIVNKPSLFTDNLTSSNMMALNRYADSKLRDYQLAEHQRKVIEQGEQKARSDIEAIRVKAGISNGTIGEADIVENGVLTGLQKQIALLHLQEYKKEETRTNNNLARIDDIHLNGGNIAEIDNKYQEISYNRKVIAAQNAAAGEIDGTGQPLRVTSIDKAQIMRSYSFVNRQLLNELIGDMEQTMSPRLRLEAAIGYMDLRQNHPTALSDYDDKRFNFCSEVIRRGTLPGANLATICENASKKYLESPTLEEKSIRARTAALIKLKLNDLPAAQSLAKLDHFWETTHAPSWAKFFLPNPVQDLNMLALDMRDFIEDAIRAGASDIDALDSATAKAQAIWKEVDGVWRRNPPELMYPNHSEIVMKNIKACNVKHSITKLSGTINSGDKFELADGMYNASSDANDFYRTNRATSERPMVKLTVNAGSKQSKEYKLPVQFESINSIPHHYFMYVEIESGPNKGARHYIKDSRDPTMKATTRFDNLPGVVR